MMTNVTVSNCSGTGLGLSYNIDTQVSNGYFPAPDYPLCIAII